MQLIKTDPDYYDPNNPSYADYSFVYDDGIVAELYVYSTPEMALIDL